ncbi:hypothetical protein [Blautia obeum]
MSDRKLLYDLIFVIIQRYNRPRFMKLLK